MLKLGTSRRLAFGFGCTVAALSGAACGADYKTLYSFQGGSDGAAPHGDLLNVHGTLYGTTAKGGAPCDCGTVFAVTPRGAETMLYAFRGGGDGAGPTSKVISVDGVLYGTTVGGGNPSCQSGYGCGTVFSLRPGGLESVVYAFEGNDEKDGYAPNSPLLDVGGTLYGTTAFGGGTAWFKHHGCGTLFSITPSGTETVLKRFEEKQGCYLVAGLIKHGVKLYSVAGAEGASNGGTIYSATLGGTVKVLYNFSYLSGPEASLIDVDGTFYGTASQGGNFLGSVFSITPAGAFANLYAFGGGSDGQEPTASLIDVNGTLFGTTFAGGGCCGTVFALAPDGTETILHAFQGGKDGANPDSGLTQVGNKLYGTTVSGGANNAGTVFSIVP